jgi:protein O-GlcNAc transferase
MPVLNVEQAITDASRLYQANELLQAQSLCMQILRVQPASADALHLHGIITARLGDPRAAIELVRRATLAKPHWPQPYYHLGNLFNMIGQRAQAIESYRTAVALKPDYLQAHNNLGVVLRESGQLDAALVAFETVLGLSPTDPNAHVNLANVYRDKGDLKRSAELLRQAIILNPGLAEAYNNLAAVLNEMGLPQESISASRHAIELRPYFAEAHNNLGSVLEEIGELDDAITSLRQAVALGPNYDQAHYNLGNALKSTGRVGEAISAYRRAIAIRPSFVEAHTNLVYAMHFHPDYDARAIFEELRRWNHQHAEPFKQWIQAHDNDRKLNRRLRIGYVSPNFKEHPVGRFLLPLFANHDKTHFEIFAYSQVSDSDKLTQTLRSHADHWHETTGMKDSKLAERIRADHIDILVDLTLHMAGSRLQMFAAKPAPVQLSWLAYCSTTGLDAVDYRLSDPYLDPLDANDSNYSERTIRLPETYWCYQPVQSAELLLPSPLPALSNNYITFGSLNNLAKVSDPALASWMQILRSVPNSRLLLHAPPGNHRRQMLEHIEKEGIDAARIQFASKLPVRDYLKLYQQIDIALDTFPYAGGTTTCDALWMGVPVVSLTGATAVGRGGCSILSNLGLSELVARSEQLYVEIAIQLAEDLPRLREIRSTLRQRMEKSPLMDAQRYARCIEAAYRQMWLSQ